MSRRFAFIILLLFVCMLTVGFMWQGLMGNLPSPESLPERFQPPSLRITDRYGRLLYEAIPETGGRHAVVPLEQIPLTLRHATIATEDRSFYTHPGVDFAGILRALWINLRQGETIAGGSTITQQVARNLMLSEDERSQRSLRRKLREMVLAWRLTQRYSKDEILGTYLNQIYYGGNAYGVEAASQTFFGKPVRELDLAECALLAGLPQAPALYNPFTEMEAALERQKVVLGLMEADGWISPEQRLMAEREPLVFAEIPYPMQAPHFVMMVRAQLDGLLTPEELLAQGGVVVRTSLDLDWQKAAEAAIQRQIEALRHSKDGLGHNVNNGALVALDPGSGEILAMVGSPDYFDAQNGGAINMALSPRQPGSALKPIVYAVALDSAKSLGKDQTSLVGDDSPWGDLYSSYAPWTAATMLLDVRTSFTTHEGKAYTPENYDLRQHGPVLLREALASSLNIPAVLTLDHIGLQALADQAEKMGITTLNDPEQYDLSLALGGGAVRLLELTAAYGAFANGGYRVNPQSILEVSDLDGNVLHSAPKVVKERALDARVAWLISDILSDNEARRLGFGPNSILRLDRPAAVKTGTTSNFHDNWTVGYTPNLVVGVWVGNTNYEAMREVTGLSGAAPIWHDFIRTVLRGQSKRDFARPSGLVQVEVCQLSGLLPTDACPYRRSEWFIEGTQPVQADKIFRQVEIDASNGSLADASTTPERRVTKVVLDLPPQAELWARSQGLLLYSDLLTMDGNSSPLPLTPLPLRLVSPANGSLYRLAAGLPSDAQRISLQAVGESGLKEVSFWVDGELVARLPEAPYETWWALQPGVHRVWVEAVRSNGERVTSQEVTFEVIG